MKRLVDKTTVDHTSSKTLKKYTRNSSLPPTPRPQLRDGSGSVVLALDPDLDPAALGTPWSSGFRKRPG